VDFRQGRRGPDAVRLPAAGKEQASDMDGKSTSSLGRATMLCIAILFGLMAAPTGVLSGFAGGLPDQIAAPFVEQWPLL